MRNLKTRGLAVLAITLVMALPAAANQLTVVTNIGGGGPQGQPEDAACVQEGQYALRVEKTIGDTSKTFVETDTPQNESVYRASFWIDPTNYNPLDFNKDGIAIALPAGAGTAPYKILSRFKPGDGLKVWCQLARNSGQKKSTARLTLANTYNHVQIEWQQASGAGINDGSCTISIIGGPNAGATATESVKNHQLSVGRFRMGLTGSLDAAADGNLCFDDFQSFRTLAP